MIRKISKTQKDLDYFRIARELEKRSAELWLMPDPGNQNAAGMVFSFKKIIEYFKKSKA